MINHVEITEGYQKDDKLLQPKAKDSHLPLMEEAADRSLPDPASQSL